jgi:5-methylcytosine-specific restriction endonuclease McrA
MNTFVRNHLWVYVREYVLRRDNLRCSICEKRKGRLQLDVDHIIPVRTGIDPYDKKNLRLLCKECHQAKTNLDREANL